MWVWFSLVSNGLLVMMVMSLLLRDKPLSSANSGTAAAVTHFEATQSHLSHEPISILGPRHRWTYEQWVEQLGREASAMALNPPEHLTILAGDSLSLWFPNQLLPLDRTWLNQGISGETTAGLLRRLKVFDTTQPETIFVMIGINDLIRGVDDPTILANYREIIQDLRWVHPNAQVVVQSILPHSNKNATWEGRDRLLKIPNDRIRRLNQELKVIADTEGAYYLDLHSLFTDIEGNLRPEFSTDGLHLNDQGYLVWRTALQLFSQMTLAATPSP